MGKSAPKPPPAPDPVAVAQAQSASNVDTARTTAALNRVNQYTPQGSLVYSQPDPNNPNQWTATQTYSPAEAANYALSTRAQNLYGTTALGALGNAAGALTQGMSTNPAAYAPNLAGMQNAAAAANQPVNTNFNDVRNQYIQSQMGLVQPQMDMQRQQLESQLANQGVVQGTPAWNNAMRQFGNQQSSMYADILSNAQTGVGNAIQQQGALQMQPIQAAAGYAGLAGQGANITGANIQQQAALLNQPLNEASALLSGSQVQGPQFTNVPQTQVDPTNVLGAYQLSQQQQQANYAAALQGQSATQGGIGSMVGTIGGAAMIAI